MQDKDRKWRWISVEARCSNFIDQEKISAARKPDDGTVINFV